MYTKLLCKTIEFGTVLIQGTGIPLSLEQLGLLANCAQERGLACSAQPSMADIFVGNRHKRTWFDITLGVYVERCPSCPRAPILYTILIVWELTEDNGFVAPELEHTLVEGDPCGFVQDPLRLGVRSTRYVFSEKANCTANGNHLVNKLIGSELRGIGSGVCGDEAKDSMSFAKTSKGTHDYVVGARPATLVCVTGKSLNAHEQDGVSTPDDATGNFGSHQRAIGN